ncbi:MAG TPA: hemolysin III family protein [Solirubrobacteraceae bacterium]|jgi:hemolysin III|nr:hemolysin III family protein [Solirubrobacteraceae bacterium]
MSAGLVEAARPRLRGVSHEIGFFVSVACGVALVATAPAGRGLVGAIVYALAVSALLGTSALYHRRDWRPAARRWMRRVDHSMIFVLIAGTYTPFALLAMHGPLATAVLVGVWCAALAAGVLEFVWVTHPRWISALLAVGLGWVSVAAMGQLTNSLGLAAVLAIALGGVLYTVGAVVYARQRPDPVPGVFGYHEVFHVLVLAAASIHYAIVAFVVLPRA